MTTTRNPTPAVECRHGAPMGRVQRGAIPTSKVTLRKIPINSGGYDRGGAYWGIGQPLYWAGDDDGNMDTFFRAADRAAAKAIVRKSFPEARFYR